MKLIQKILPVLQLATSCGLLVLMLAWLGELFTENNTEIIDEKRTVALYDHGLQMVQGHYQLPEGWELYQDIASDPHMLTSSSFNMVFTSPDGAQVHVLHPKPQLFVPAGADSIPPKKKQRMSEYQENNYWHQDYRKAAQQLLDSLFDEVTAEEWASVEWKYLREQLKATGNKNGKQFEVLVRAPHYPMDVCHWPFKLENCMVIAPEGQMAEALNQLQELQNSLVPNRAYLYYAYQNHLLKNTRSYGGEPFADRVQRWYEEYGSYDPYAVDVADITPSSNDSWKVLEKADK